MRQPNVCEQIGQRDAQHMADGGERQNAGVHQAQLQFGHPSPLHLGRHRQFQLRHPAFSTEKPQILANSFGDGIRYVPHLAAALNRRFAGGVFFLWSSP